MKDLNEYDFWLTSITDKINALKQRLPQAISNKLDNSINSVDVLEKYLMELYSTEMMIEEKNSGLLDELASYIGNIAEKEMPGCHWTINLNDAKDIDFGFPVLKFKDSRASFNPFTYITMALDRKRGNLISAAIIRRKDIANG